MGGSSSKKKDETKRMASNGGGGEKEAEGRGEKGDKGEKKFGYEDMIAKDPAEVGGKIHLENIAPFISKLLRDDDVNVKRALVYCNYILSGIFSTPIYFIFKYFLKARLF